MSSPCACTDGRMGAQTCNADGTYGACTCGGGFDAGGTGGTGGAGVDAGPPMMGVGSRQIVPGTMLLVGSGQNSCTNQNPATGDRWCAMAMPSTLQNFVDLWVVNVSKALAGTAISCASGADPNCIRLTTNLFVDNQSGLSIHGFDGDTLIYMAETGPTFVAASATDAGTGFIGPVYAWRPGWSGGRKLTSDSGVVCIGHSKTDSALCFENEDITTVTTQRTFDLLGGQLPAAGAGLLPKVETLLVQLMSDPANSRFFQVSLSPDGAYIAYSARPNATSPETLKLKHIGDAAAPAMVAADVSRWLISSDSSHWYWLKTYNYSTSGAGSGTLQTAVYPGGATPAMLAAGVGDFDEAGTKGVLFRDGLASGAGALKLMADRDAPTTVKTIDTKVLGVLDRSNDGTKVLYAKTFDSVNQVVDLYVGTSTSTAPCTLVSTALAPPVGGFLPGGSGIVWSKFDPNTGIPDGYFTNVATCTSTKFGSAMIQWLAIGDQGYMYMDDYSPSALAGTIRASKVTNSMLPAGASLQTQADSVYASLLPSVGAVVYVVATGTAADGLYVNDMLPFTAGN